MLFKKTNHAAEAGSDHKDRKVAVIMAGSVAAAALIAGSVFAATSVPSASVAEAPSVSNSMKGHSATAADRLDRLKLKTITKADGSTAVVDQSGAEVKVPAAVKQATNGGSAGSTGGSGGGSTGGNAPAPAPVVDPAPAPAPVVDPAPAPAPVQQGSWTIVTNSTYTPGCPRLGGGPNLNGANQQINTSGGATYTATYTWQWDYDIVDWPGNPGGKSYLMYKCSWF